jgi:hypothetical protein
VQIIAPGEKQDLAKLAKIKNRRHRLRGGFNADAIKSNGGWEQKRLNSR